MSREQCSKWFCKKAVLVCCGDDISGEEVSEMWKSVLSWSKMTGIKEENAVFSVLTRKMNETDPGPRYWGDIFLGAKTQGERVPTDLFGTRKRTRTKKGQFWKMKLLAAPQRPQKYFRVNNMVFWGLRHSSSFSCHLSFPLCIHWSSEWQLNH